MVAGLSMRYLGTDLLPAAWGQVRMEGKITQVHEKTFGGDGYVHYLDCGDSFTGVYFKFIKLYTLYTIYYMSIICQ